MQGLEYAVTSTPPLELGETPRYAKFLLCWRVKKDRMYESWPLRSMCFKSCSAMNESGWEVSESGMYSLCDIVWSPVVVPTRKSKYIRQNFGKASSLLESTMLVQRDRVVRRNSSGRFTYPPSENRSITSSNTPRRIRIGVYILIRGSEDFLQSMDT